ncbi:Clavaminate synthase-like protein [Dothidotthia symphoricarpi CBS 119687]|uniref:Clavaminate synthase-like protein n=1 Tax=Dothidotthia symphoricarpi CBS 119687 TaxID=1392245 RepID=A0A6A6A808_9PLEO|nr:Clavaminate synthase-like protein [Dothidotthia symphoricarpi CBS 119687]KAF2127989.1 Clavaminate synthase-like protein [Dothidotthia symphoricarpi CBS 119687]
MSTPQTFTTIPILPLSQALDADTKPQFLADLRSALLNVGFLYLSETGLPDGLVRDVISECGGFFERLPLEAKEQIEMKNQKSFLGWSRVDNETTAFNPDHREQLDLSTPHPIPGPEAPTYHNLLAPNQWPSTQYLPTFRPVYEDYMRRMSHISTLFTSLIAEAIGLPSDAFTKFFDKDQQHKLKIVKYPEVDVPNLPENATEIDRKKWEIKRQGVGPHKDSMLTSYLLQASNQLGLQAQNAKGEWIDCKPIAGTLVVAIGQGMEALTDGVCASTTHRVLSPRKGEGARYSVPFFQGVSYDAEFEAMDVPASVLKLRDEARKARKDDVEFTFVKGRWGHLGEATLMNRVKSHPDVGERWYPQLLQQVRAQQAAPVKIV